MIVLSGARIFDGERFLDDHAIVVERSNRHGVAVLGLQAPHEAGTPIGQRIDGVQLRPEALHDRVVERCPNSPDVYLRQMETRHVRSSFALPTVG